MLYSNVMFIDHLRATLFQQLSQDAGHWLKTGLRQLSTGGESSSEIQLRCSALARRMLGTEQLTELPGVSQWQADEAGRLLLLAQLLESSPREDQATLLKAAFKQGDEYEQIAIIKGLDLLDRQGALADLAIHAGRTNSIKLFAAIVLNNLYPSTHYDDRSFNQLVLKALFMGLDIVHLLGLQQRQTVTLSRLCFDLVKERLLADRSPPHSIWLAINFCHLGVEEQATYLNFTTDRQPAHRYYSLLALSRNDVTALPRSLWSVLKQQRITESEDKISELILLMFNQYNGQTTEETQRHEIF